MKITFSPIRHDEQLTIQRDGDALILNGTPFDFTDLPDGATLPQDAISGQWFAGDVQRIDGVLHLTILLPHGAKAPHETLFPEPITVTADGPVTLPPYTTALEDEA